MYYAELYQLVPIKYMVDVLNGLTAKQLSKWNGLISKLM